MKPRRGARGRARARKAAGATRFCMGAAWREVKDGPAFDGVLDDGARRARAGPGGLLHARHAHRDAGAAPRRGGPRRLQPQPRHLARSSTVRSSPRAPTTIACARSRNVRKAGITVCSGGIIGMGESLDDRCGMLHDAREPRSAAGERADQRARAPCDGHAARGSAARRSARARAHDRHRAHPDAARRACACPPGAPRSRARRSCCASSPAPTRSSTARSCSPRQPRRRGRPRAAPRRRPARRGRGRLTAARVSDNQDRQPP